MSARFRWTKASEALLLSVVLSLASFSSATAQSHKKSKKAPPPLPSGPTGPVQQIPLDSIAAVPPQVSFQNNQLTIVAPNSTLSDILRAVKKLTGAEIDVPSAPERVVTHLGPGPVREVMAELLNGSRFNYVLLGSPDDQNGLSRVVLVGKSGPQDVAPNPNPNPTEQEQGTPQSALRPLMPPQQQEVLPEASEVDPAAEENAPPDDNNDQNSADADQQQENPGVKTPQQMLQEMQQRQLQLQQNQPPGQPPVPGSGMPPHPPQEQ